MLFTACLLGLAGADQRFFMPLPGASPAQNRWQPAQAQRTPTQAVYMHHGEPHEHAEYETFESLQARAEPSFLAAGASGAAVQAAPAPAPQMPLAWQLVPAALLLSVGLYAARGFAMFGVGGHHGEPREHFEAGTAQGEDADRAMLGVGGTATLEGRVVPAPLPQLNGLLARRSVAKYDTSRAVPADVVQRALDAAVLAPNHFLSEPWRFYTCGPETKAKLCGLNEEKRKMAEGVPEWLVVTFTSEHEENSKLFYEDHAAVACATQNFMLSLANEGVGSKWMTGALGAAPEDVLAAVGAGAGERLVGAVWFGYPAKELSEEAKSPPRKKGLEGTLTKLP